MSELSDFDDMYQEVIIDHYKNPRNSKKLSGKYDETKAHNPFCGDEIELQLSISDDGIIENVSVTGRGCAISQSSGSLMSDSIYGKSVDEARSINLNIRSMLKDEELSDEDLDAIGDSYAIEGVKKFPVRIKCALLSWAALKDLTDKY
ncbi:MAG: SUF system NifU family Fe-S cluster assembly protein [Dehalococcoidia bacterium]|nr:SUF system NifU family Fe-S cluster assembly protein [Dehalococcoidia bacterium]MBH60737.1 SUF system NifU family Fe-S cluster assembly protein [Dehalococcoidia bacterium]|tara:strand:- start:2253 stop:2696 length:444 start_codon:yes stop_codon:yes gene_type:complete